MSKHSMRRGGVVQPQQFLQVVEARAQGLPAGQPRGQRSLRIALGHLQELRAIAAHAGFQFHRAAGMLAQQLGQDLPIRQRLAEDQFARHRSVEVVLRDELGQHIGRLGVQRQPREEIARTQADAVAEEQHADAGHARLDATGDHIHVRAGALHVVLRLQLAQRGDLVAQFGGTLELQRLAGLLHRLGQLVDHRIAAPFEKHLGMAHVVAIVLHADQPHARRAAAADLVLQARPRAIAEIAVLALAHLEQLLHQAETFAHRVGTGIRPEIAPRQVLRAAMERQPRIVLAAG